MQQKETNANRIHRMTAKLSSKLILKNLMMMLVYPARHRFPFPFVRALGKSRPSARRRMKLLHVNRAASDGQRISCDFMNRLLLVGRDLSLAGY